MTRADRNHFDDYKLQTQVKHAILAAYLPAYFNILKSQHRNLVYLDGFAGSGHYHMENVSVPGSPLRALDVVASSTDLAKRVQCIFIERDARHFEALREAVAQFCRTHPGIKEPILRPGQFSKEIDALLSELGDDELAPTFLFVDPCGVEGVSMRRVAEILVRKSCEVFLFFNLDGIRRIAGLTRKGGTVSPVLIDLYGSEELASSAVEDFLEGVTPEERELRLLAHYRAALQREAGAQFVIPLRVESEARAATSHYLLHATKHSLGFKIMKDVMWAHGGGIECDGPRLNLLQASRRAGPRLFSPEKDSIKSSILEQLRKGTQPVSLFRNDWVLRPEDMFAGSVYREQLLELEASKEILVLDENGRAPLPVELRPKRNGVPTISERLFVRRS